MKITLEDGTEVEVEVELTPGFTVQPKLPPFPDGPGGGEPLPIEDAA